MFLVEKGSFIYLYGEYKNERHSFIYLLPGLARTLPSVLKVIRAPTHTFGAVVTPQVSISTCGVWGARAGVQVSRRELHTHIHLD